MATIPHRNTIAHEILARLHERKIQTALGIIAILAISLLVTGWAEYQNGYNSGNSDGYNSAYYLFQQSAISAKGSDAKLLQQSLDKMADLSQNKSAKVAAGKFDVLASIFRLAGSSANVTLQNQTLCNQSATQDFNQTAILTNHSNITSTHRTVCSQYALVARDFQKSVDPTSFQNLNSDFTDLVFDLMKLDNTISQDP